MKRRISSERKKRSWVWEYFIEDNEKVEPDKSINWVKCKIQDCKTASIKMKNRSTSNLAYHLKQFHGITTNNANEEISEEITESKIEIFSKAKQDLIDLKLYVNSSFCKLLILLELTSLQLRIQQLLWWIMKNL